MNDLERLEHSLKAALSECEKALGRDDGDAHECCPVLEELARTGHDRKTTHEN